MTRLVKLTTGSSSAGRFTTITLGKYRMLIFDNMPIAIEEFAGDKLLAIHAVTQTGGDIRRERFISILATNANAARSNTAWNVITPEQLKDLFITAIGHVVTEITKEKML